MFVFFSPVFLHLYWGFDYVLKKRCGTDMVIITPTGRRCSSSTSSFGTETPMG